MVYCLDLSLFFPELQIWPIFPREIVCYVDTGVTGRVLDFCYIDDKIAVCIFWFYENISAINALINMQRTNFIVVLQLTCYSLKVPFILKWLDSIMQNQYVSVKLHFPHAS